jgi:cytochrome P450
MMDAMAASTLSSAARVTGPPARSAAAILVSLARSPLDAYVGLAARYGDTIRVPLGPRSAFFLLSRPEHAEHVLAARQDNYVKAFTYKPLRALIGDGLLTSEGETWRQHRRLVQPVFARRDVPAFGPAIAAATRRMLTNWASRPAGSQLDVARQMSALTLDVVGAALFGSDLSGEADQMSRALAAGQRVAMLSTFLPLRWGPRSARAVRAAATRLSRTPDGIEGPVGRLIAARRAQREAGRDTARRDLLDVLLTASAEDGSVLPDSAVEAEVTTFLLAGHETSASALSWSLALLSAYPAARQRLEDEVDAVLGGRDPSAADVPDLPWTTAIISEAMRLYPPAWTIERDAAETDDIAGVPVPAGSLVAVPPYLVHRNPEFWPDPAGFDPARFLGPPDRPRYAYIPFGGGRRACVGQAFAELETVLVLAAIARQFRLELTGAGMPKPDAYVTLRLGHGLPMRLLRR